MRYNTQYITDPHRFLHDAAHGVVFAMQSGVRTRMSPGTVSTGGPGITDGGRVPSSDEDHPTGRVCGTDREPVVANII